MASKAKQPKIKIDANIIVLSHKKSKTIQYCIASLKKFNYKYTIAEGYDFASNPGIKPIKNFEDKVLDLAIKKGKGMLFIEDDTIILEKFPAEVFANDISWVAHWKTDRSGVPGPGFIGSNIIYFSRKALLKMKHDLNNKKYKSKHQDIYINKFISNNPQLTFKEIKGFEWREKAHYSYNTGEKGARLHKRVIF